MTSESKFTDIESLEGMAMQMSALQVSSIAESTGIDPAETANLFMLIAERHFDRAKEAECEQLSHINDFTEFAIAKEQEASDLDRDYENI